MTPLRDGMNLVAKEYVATRGDGAGVLILSEMAGAAKELPEAIIINPNNRAEIATRSKKRWRCPCGNNRNAIGSCNAGCAATM